MELATICCDATGRRVYGERDMKKRGRGVARSGAEEVVEGHFGLDVSIVLSGNETVGRDKRNMKHLFYFRRIPNTFSSGEPLPHPPMR